MVLVTYDADEGVTYYADYDYLFLYKGTTSTSTPPPTTTFT